MYISSTYCTMVRLEGGIARYVIDKVILFIANLLLDRSTETAIPQCRCTEKNRTERRKNSRMVRRAPRNQSQHNIMSPQVSKPPGIKWHEKYHHLL